jgi:hypothetical protein
MKVKIKLLDGTRLRLGQKCGNQHGLHCPKCGSSECISICAEQFALLRTDGVDSDGDVTWSDNSAACCHEDGCNWTGSVAELIQREIDGETLRYT